MCVGAHGAVHVVSCGDLSPVFHKNVSGQIYSVAWRPPLGRLIAAGTESSAVMVWAPPSTGGPKAAPRLQREHDVRIQLALALIIGGALGNVIDRLWLGKVIDFVLVYWTPWNWYYPAFNVADSAISIGAVLMLWSAFFAARSGQGNGQA